MPPIERTAAKECVQLALKNIADFNGDFESFTFAHWHEFHKSVFINAVAANVRKKGSRIVLNEGMIAQFASLRAFVDYVHAESVFLGEPKQNLRQEQGDLTF